MFSLKGEFREEMKIKREDSTGAKNWGSFQQDIYIYTYISCLKNKFKKDHVEIC